MWKRYLDTHPSFKDRPIKKQMTVEKYTELYLSKEKLFHSIEGIKFTEKLRCIKREPNSTVISVEELESDNNTYLKMNSAELMEIPQNVEVQHAEDTNVEIEQTEEVIRVVNTDSTKPLEETVNEISYNIQSDYFNKIVLVPGSYIPLYQWWTLKYLGILSCRPVNIRVFHFNKEVRSIILLNEDGGTHITLLTL